MAGAGKAVTLFLIDGTPTGRVKCSLANWTGVVFKLPRTEIDAGRDRAELRQSGVYFLFGTDEESGKSVVYIGQAGVRKNGEGLLQRLQEHRRNPEKDYWTEAVVVTTSNNSFGPTEISYLENRFCNLALEANRCRVKNGNDPSPGNITEEKESELEEFIYFAKIAIGALGFRIFEPLVRRAPHLPQVTPEAEVTGPKETEPEETLYFRRPGSSKAPAIDASCQRTREGYVVLKGSRVRPQLLASFPGSLLGARQSADISADGLLREDVLFTSPSAAGSFVCGASCNGLTSWKTADGKTIKELEEAEAALPEKQG